MVYSTRRFFVCLSVCHFVLVFFSPFSIAITSLGEERANLNAFSYVCSICACLDLSVSSSSWGLGRAAVCDCGTPWTFLLLFLSMKGHNHETKVTHFRTVCRSVQNEPKLNVCRIYPPSRHTTLKESPFCVDSTSSTMNRRWLNVVCLLS